MDKMASDVCIALFVVASICMCPQASSGSGTPGIGLEFTSDPVKQSIAVLGSVTHLSCSTNLPVDSMTWLLNHHPIPPEKVIHVSENEISEYLAYFNASNCLHCNDTDTRQLQKNIKLMTQNEMLTEGKLLTGTLNGSSYILVFFSRDDREAAHQIGIYQCMASLGTMSLVSAPGRLELASLAACPPVAAETMSVVAGSAVRVPCTAPDSVPEAVITFYKDGAPMSGSEDTLQVTPEGDVLLLSVSPQDSGEYHCAATNAVLRATRTCPTSLYLHVELPTGAPEGTTELISPRPGLLVTTEGEDVTLSCITNRGLTDVVTFWTRSPSPHRFDAGILHTNHSVVTTAHLEAAADDVVLTNESAGSWRLRLPQVSLSDAGQYVCHARDGDTSLSVAVQLYVRAAPLVVSGLQRQQVGEGQQLEASCLLTGEPAPLLLWLSNGRLLHPSPHYSMSRGVLTVQSVTKADAGVLQCFGHNAVGSTSSAALITVTPATVHTRHHVGESHDVDEDQPLASSEAAPPSRPTVTRVADDTVRLHWQPSPSPVRFYKVQYRVLERGDPPTHAPHAPGTRSDEPQVQRVTATPVRHRWQTEDNHIPAERTSTVVSSLTPGLEYKFRVTAVLTSYQQRVSPSSRRFLLKPMRPLTPPAQRPFITEVRWLRDAGGRQAEVQWRYGGARGGTDGFLINLRPANSSLAFVKRRFLGGERRSIVLTDMPAPEGGVEVRVQAFNLAGPSPPSPPRLLPSAPRQLSGSGPHGVSLPERAEAASLPGSSEGTALHKRPVHTDRRALWPLGAQLSSEEGDSSEQSRSDEGGSSRSDEGGSSRSDEGGSYSNESGYSSEGDDSDERQTSSRRSGLSSAHLLGLLVFVLLALLAVVAISYGLYSQREKRAGYGVPLEQLSVSASDDHVGCATVPQGQVRGPSSQAPAESPPCRAALSRDCYRAETTKPTSLSLPD